MEENVKVERTVINNMRYYKVTQFADEHDTVGIIRGIFPSITTILSNTADKSFLKKWEQKIGKEAADKITENATRRGTVMHRLCEIYLGLPMDMPKEERLEKTITASITDAEICSFDNRAIIVGGMLFYNYIRSGSFDFIKKNIVTERFLWTDKHGGYAGTVDNISEMVATELLGEHAAVIDFKTALKPKDNNRIEDYKIQTSAYAVMAYHRLGIKVKRTHIMISNEKTETPQIFTLEAADLKHYYGLFQERLNAFYNKFPPISLEVMSAENDLF